MLGGTKVVDNPGGGGTWSRHAGRAWLEVCIVTVDGVEGSLGVGHISLLGFSIWLDSHLLVHGQVCLPGVA